MTFKGFFDLFSETLMFHCSLFDNSLLTLWRVISETLIISMETFLISIVFVVLTSESMMFPCFFIDESLMNLWRNIDGTTKIWIKTFLIIKVFSVRIFKICYFIAARLINRCWWFFEETLMRPWWFWCKQKWWKSFCCGILRNIDGSLLLRRGFVDDSLEKHKWNINNFDGNLLIFIDSVVLTSGSLMFHCFFNDDSLMTP